LSEDCKRIEAILDILGPDDQLAVDANGRFDIETAINYGKALSQYNLFWYEEPGDPLDFELHKQLSQNYMGSIATGENLFSVQDARKPHKICWYEKRKRLASV
jgi:L-alanine-DL-glutamate epimerase-like enolase superfamily enzyme